MLDKGFIMNRVRIDPASGCWNWIRTRNKAGYGKTCRANGSELAHRISWEVFRGKIPLGLCVLHRCDNRRCCNPDHLFIGTYLDNNRDCAIKGRRKHLIGERACHAKLTERAVLEIRALRASGRHSLAKIGRMFNVSANHIQSIVTGKLWAHAGGITTPANPNWRTR